MSHQGREVRRALSERLSEVIAEFAASLPEHDIAEELNRLGGDLRVRTASPDELPGAHWLPGEVTPAVLEVEIDNLARFERIWRGVLAESRLCVRVPPGEARTPGILRLHGPRTRGANTRGTLTLKVRRARHESGELLLEVERPGLATRLRGEELRRMLGAASNENTVVAMPESPPPLSSLPHRYDVDLSSQPFASVLRTHLDDPSPGYLQVVQPRGVTTFLLAERAVWEVWQAPHPESIALSTLLLRGGQLDTEQLARATARATSKSCSLEQALLELKLLSARHLALTRRARILYVLDPGGARWQRGQARFYALETSPALDSSTRVELGTHLFGRTLKAFLALPEQELRSRISQPGAGPFILREQPGLGRRQLAASPQITPVVQALLDGPCRTTRLLELDLPESTVAAALLTLHHFDLLHALAPPHRQAASGDEAFEDPGLDALRRLDARIESDDHFAFLDLHWSAYSALIQRAYLSLREQILTPEFSADLLPLKARILARLDLAHAELANPQRRADYRDTLIDACTRETSLATFRSELQSAQHQGHLTRALDLAQRILELAPDCASTRALACTLRAAQVQQRTSIAHHRKD
ncbi:hypothetical protein EA187_01020 [Lujinxingia sediminis]|uniref:Bacterial transcriptional activator domain-containing protein n=1 Tax=Lujinxingia sediminis TaxID=2480984 RepID=A0ABY0CVZ9_9DELT|nr:hypothetical protein [Lujinxingia sediminis]RVU48048.1 hypothetical protein EA187_01020 [Lujinxingia sediminis]